MSDPKAPITVAELFAGVGGFRLGLERKGVARKLKNRTRNKSFKVIWSNQYEPKTKKQHASDIYVKHFNLVEDDSKEGVYRSSDKSEAHINLDINEVIASELPEHDLLVAGFPCQDYSVMRAISREIRDKDGTASSGEMGIRGPRGELWWEIERILQEKKPRMVLLENVPRLLSSPSLYKGKNFAIVVESLVTLGYVVEWRTINAADYSMPQSRNRVFIIAYNHIYFPQFSTHTKAAGFSIDCEAWLRNEGPFAEAFPLDFVDCDATFVSAEMPADFNRKKSFFTNLGMAYPSESADQIIVSQIQGSKPKKAKLQPLQQIIEKKISKENLAVYSIPLDEISKWRYLKDMPRKEFRIKKDVRANVSKNNLKLYDSLMLEPKLPPRQKMWDDNRDVFLQLVNDGLAYRYDIGAMRFPDHLNDTSRTLVTSEGGKGASRTRHIIVSKDSPSKFRRLMPVELERLNQFPDNWTSLDSGIPDTRRGFLMGNALVVGIVERLAGPIERLIRRRGEAP